LGQVDARLLKDTFMNIKPMTDGIIGVFGATGQTARNVVRHAPQQGYRVRALARDPRKMDVADGGLMVVQGDFESVAALEETVKGTTHVILCAGGAYEKGYDKGMMTRFTARLWPMLEAEASLETFLFQSVFFAPEPDDANPFTWKSPDPVAAFFTGSTEMLKDDTAVTKFMDANRREAFGYIVTRPGKIVETEAGVDLMTRQKFSFAPISFADLDAFTVGAVQDASLHGKYPFIASKT
jgi:hypothetical protein